jgi:hypothetical protein
VVNACEYTITFTVTTSGGAGGERIKEEYDNTFKWKMCIICSR